MTQKLTFIFDCDGVVADFVAGTVDLLNGLVGEPRFRVEHVTVWEIRSLLLETMRARYHLALRAPGFASALALYQEAVDFVRSLQAAGHDVVFATAPLTGSPTWMQERTQWLHARFGRLPIHYLWDKSPVRGDRFVDDKLEHVEEWAAANPNGIAFLLDKPYNRAVQLAAPNARRIARVEDVAHGLTLEFPSPRTARGAAA